MAALFVFALKGFTAVWVQGVCRLSDNIDNSGSVVVFNAASPSAVTDSVFTNVQGVYQILITPGIYNISYSHTGYFPAQVTGVNCFSPRNLEDQNLILRVGIPISGSLSGTLSDTTYLVEGDIFVEAGNILTIEPGTRFYFDGDYSFTIYGGLTATGTQSDSILFIPSPRVATWRGIFLGPNNNLGDILFEYCHLAGSSLHGINADLHSVDLSMRCIIDHCTITGNIGDGIYSDNYLISKEILQILNCWIAGNGSGIKIFGSATIKDCNIRNNQLYGIHIEAFGDIDIKNCVVKNNDDGAGAAFGIYVLSSSPEFTCRISNCVVTDNPTGILFGNMGVPTNSVLLNTVVSSNNIGIGFAVVGGSVTGCDFFDNTQNYSMMIPQYLGQKIMTNINGDSCDAFLNIFEDPFFVDAFNDDFHLQEASPCINAGDPSSPLDPDGTIADIGAFYFNTGLAPDISVSSQYLYFNDTFLDSSTTMSLIIHNTGSENLLLYDISVNHPSYQTDWDPADSLINPTSSIEINITFTPHTFDIHTGTISISSNDRSAFVGLSGMCVPQGVSYVTSLVVAGGGTDPANWNYFINNTSPSATDAFSKLAFGRYYTGTRLFYMNPVGWQDLNGDGLDDGIIDSDELTPQSVRSALMGLVDDPNPAYPNVISLSGHGHVGEFDINGNAEDHLSSDSLALWLDQINLDQLSPLVVVLEACFSGSFVPVLAGDNRIVIAACRADQFADYLNGECFSTNFWEEIWYGNNVWDAFFFAYQRAQMYLNGQEPLLDADGNGIPNEATDEAIAQNVFLGGELMHGALLPEIREYPDEVYLSGGQVSVIVRCNGVMDCVWFRIFPANYSGMPPVYELPIVQMNHIGSFNYSGSYTNDGFFQTDGEYIVQVDALDDIYNHAIPKIIPLVMQATNVRNQSSLPRDFRLCQNYPNPFNATTTIEYAVPKVTEVKMIIYNIRGQEVFSRIQESVVPGWYTFTWSGNDLRGKSMASGLYLYRFEAEGFSQVNKMLLLK